MFASLRFLLLQVRNPDDSMRTQEVRSFARVLEIDPHQIEPFDLLTAAPSREQIDRADLVLLGGSGHYSARYEGAWIERALDALRDLHAQAKPTFASCWGFQAMARALGGRLASDPEWSEIGSVEMRLTPAGQQDPVFSPLGETFVGQAGHQDSVVELPPDAVNLAFSDKAPHQAYRFADLPIYCTQFHPELNRQDLLERVLQYPEYIERIAGLPASEFASLLLDTLETEELLRRFVRTVLS